MRRRMEIEMEKFRLTWAQSSNQISFIICRKSETKEENFLNRFDINFNSTKVFFMPFISNILSLITYSFYRIISCLLN